MNVFNKVADFLSGGLGETIVKGVKAYFPPSMSDSEKANLEMAIKNQTQAALVEIRQLAQQEREQFNNRIKELEGTASDLARFGFIGSMIIFLRGCQRPVWGYLTLYMDLMWFSGKWGVLTDLQQSAFWIINLLVLGFLFGERAIKNLMPMITEMLKQKSKG